MIKNPKKVTFNTPMDVVDYITKGAVPTKKNFELILNAIKEQGENPAIEDTAVNYDSVETWITQDESAEITDIVNILNRVYYNRRKNMIRRIPLYIAATAAGAVAGFILSTNSQKKACKKCHDVLFDYDEDYDCDCCVEETPVNALPTNDTVLNS